MKTFFEFMSYKDVKLMIINVLDPEGITLDPEDKNLLSRNISEFKNKENLLTDPALSDIINQSNNREAIVTAIDSDDTTIGNLVSLITEE